MGIDSFLCAPNAISKAAGPLVGGGGGKGVCTPGPRPLDPPLLHSFVSFSLFPFNSIY